MSEVERYKSAVKKSIVGKLDCYADKVVVVFTGGDPWRLYIPSPENPTGENNNPPYPTSRLTFEEAVDMWLNNLTVGGDNCSICGANKESHYDDCPSDDAMNRPVSKDSVRIAGMQEEIYRLREELKHARTAAFSESVRAGAMMDAIKTAIVNGYDCYSDKVTHVFKGNDYQAYVVHLYIPDPLPENWNYEDIQKSRLTLEEAVDKWFDGVIGKTQS